MLLIIFFFSMWREHVCQRHSDGQSSAPVYDPFMEMILNDTCIAAKVLRLILYRFRNFSHENAFGSVHLGKNLFDGAGARGFRFVCSFMRFLSEYSHS